MTPPKRVKIGCMTWAIVEVEGLPDMGLCDEEKQTIAIRAGLPPDVATVTLWHELIHAMLYALGYRKHSERLVDGLAYQMVSLLRENKELFK